MVMVASRADKALTCPHHSSCAATLSLTTRLSLGDRPVLAPDSVASAPVDVMNEPFSYSIACSYSSVLRFVFNHTRLFIVRLLRMLGRREQRHRSRVHCSLTGR
jgi:hypothetical protein